MTLTPAGIASGWQVETLPEKRVMGEGVLLPDGRILMLNGAHSGVAGYGELRLFCMCLDDRGSEGL